MRPDPSLRSLLATDAAMYQALRLRGLRECPAAFASSYEEEVDSPLSKVAERLGPKTTGAVFGVFEGSDLVGIVGLQREAMRKLSHKAFIWGMYVAPEARRSGVGGALVRHALRFAARELGVRQVNLGVNTRNNAAVALYESIGFRTYGTEREFLLVEGEFHDEYQMVCKVENAI